MTNSLVFITGGTGYIGSHVINATLKAGYRVRVSVRKAGQADEIVKRYPEYASKIETVLVPDLSKPESLKKVFKDVDFIFHLASPMPGSGYDVKTDYVDPAVQATEALLYAALDFPQIQKVVVMSSALALTPVESLFAPEATLEDNTGKVIPVDLGMDFPEGFAGHGLKYSASKILAHQATRSFVAQHKPSYNLLTFHPTFVMGHSLIQHSAESIDGINGLFWQSLFSEKPLIAQNAWVHVKDIADAHIKALEVSVESGTEFLLSGPRLSWEDAVAFIKNRYPTLELKLEPPFKQDWLVNVTKANEVLKLQWRSQETLIQEVIDQQLSFSE